MRRANEKIFDEVISGTTATWYTPDRFNELLGQADGYAIQAVTTDISGSGNLKVGPEFSSDGQDWIVVGTAGPWDIDDAIGEGASLVGTEAFGTINAARLRFAIRFSGAGSPKARVRLYVTTRTSG
jgi:hypothetical protein